MVVFTLRFRERPFPIVLINWVIEGSLFIVFRRSSTEKDSLERNLGFITTYIPVFCDILRGEPIESLFVCGGCSEC